MKFRGDSDIMKCALLQTNQPDSLVTTKTHQFTSLEEINVDQIRLRPIKQAPLHTTHQKL